MPTTPITHDPEAAPVAPKRAKDVSVHGERRIDDYFWLRERDDPRVRKHLLAENAHTAAWFMPHAALRKQLYEEMLARIQQDDEDVPCRDGRWWYSSRTLAGRQYPVEIRRAAAGKERHFDANAPDEVLLDLNEMAEGKPYLELGSFDVSPDGRWLAFSLDETGGLDYTLHVKELASGAVLPLAIERTEGAVWGNDNRTLYYLTVDEARRAHRLWRHLVGSGRPDRLLFEEPDEAFSLGLGKTRDHRYVVLQIDSADTSEVRVLDADRALARPRVVLPRRSGIEYSIDHREGLFYLLVNDTGRNNRLASIDARRPDLSRATELIAHRGDVMLEEADVFARHLVVTERIAGSLQLRVRDLASGEEHRVAFDEPVYSASGFDNAEFDTVQFRFEYTSLVTPATVYDYDLTIRERVLRKREPVLGGFDASIYASERVDATAPDGTKVPISLVYRRDLRANAGANTKADEHTLEQTNEARPQPLLLYGYGSYGIPSEPEFSSARLSLLDRGVVFAIAHVRGGGDLGRTWHDAGKMAEKHRSFSDFIACAEALIEQGWTEPSRLIIKGGSAGGLLVAAAVNQRPELFKAMVAEVPFVDVINTMLDESLPLTVGEFLEWGNPKFAEQYAWLRAWSPYDNLRRAAYPAMLLETGFNDSQVQYWEPVKYAARLRTLKTDDNPVLLQINLDAGHGGASGRFDALWELSLSFTFMLDQWGLAR
ncbi:S9 family peptidase [Methylibium sp.]|uniref:S9 family peptidase n=1 Tax=Methylibium sp. TaxID=2067992 RepID=UPI0017AC7644|nr:S9 family peptidase [Methylibium sp.]MBA3589551.1 S9 family peptidase [Methylibium sp.]